MADRPSARAANHARTEADGWFVKNLQVTNILAGCAALSGHTSVIARVHAQSTAPSTLVTR